MTNSVDPHQTAPVGAVCSGFTPFAFILNSSVMLGNYLLQTNFQQTHFQMHFFLGALRVKHLKLSISIKILVTIPQIVYSCMTAISPNWFYELPIC